MKFRVTEIYPSLQGEGLLVGTPSTFIRLQGCNLRCPWCDQPTSLEFMNGKELPLEEILEEVKQFPFKHVVITGGEPFAHKGLRSLIGSLLEEGLSVQVETNGTLWTEGLETVADRIHITCSPKAVANFYVHPRILEYAREMKFVVDDILEVKHVKREEFLKFLREERVVLQPESNRKEMLKKALEIQRELARNGFSVRVIPQIHKMLGLP